MNFAADNKFTIYFRRVSSISNLFNFLDYGTYYRLKSQKY